MDLKRYLHLAFLYFCFNSFGQTTYTGFIDKYPIELSALIYSDSEVEAVYVYTNVDTPIQLNGKIVKGTLILTEMEASGKASARFSFPGFSENATNVSGIWTNLITKRQLTVKLTKSYSLTGPSPTVGKDQELIQTESLKDHYFKLVIEKNAGAYEPRVKAVKVLEKKTDRTVQIIKVDCQLWGLNNITIGDFNFDGKPDFSVFESSYAGANTSSLYYLYDSTSGRYIDSKYSGTSLEFDPKTKTITEYNQCCAGQQVTTAVYKVVNNKMVMTEQHCFIWDEKKQELVERTLKDCQ